MYKNQLQELAQRSCFNLPSYACIREGPDHAPRFKSTVNFNGEYFESPNFCTTLRQAEHTAAEVALNVLSKKGPSKVLASRVLDETGVYKNLLQETAHRAGLKLPVYTTVRSGPGHVPVYSCTVELAGMNFTGEPAKTKKQAQKTAAMSAWSALKILSKSSFSSSSSPTPTESGGKDEQEQVTVARYLATLQPQDTNNLGQRDRQFQCRPGSSQREVVPYRGGRSFHSSRRQKWAYSRFSPEVPMSHISPEDLAFRQLSHQLALSSTPSISFRPHIFPVFQYILQPDHGSYLFAQKQEPVSNVPGIGSPLYFSNYAMPVPVRSDSGVTIREIEEKPQVEEELLNGEGDADCRTSNLPSNIYMSSLIEVPDVLASLNSNAKQIKEDMSQNTRKITSSAPNTRNLVHPESYEIEQGNRISLRHVEAKFRPRGQNADAAEFRPTNTHILNYLQSKFTPQSIHKTGSPGAVRGFVPTSFAAPVMVRPASAGSLRPEGSVPLTPTPPTRIVSSTRPWLQETKGIRGMPVTHTMAPAVHIRSVVPVCSAPPAKRSAGPSQEGSYPGAERMRAEKQSEDMSDATSKIGKLHI